MKLKHVFSLFLLAVLTITSCKKDMDESLSSDQKTYLPGQYLTENINEGETEAGHVYKNLDELPNLKATILSSLQGISPDTTLYSHLLEGSVLEISNNTASGGSIYSIYWESRGNTIFK